MRAARPGVGAPQAESRREARAVPDAANAGKAQADRGRQQRNFFEPPNRGARTERERVSPPVPKRETASDARPNEQMRSRSDRSRSERTERGAGPVRSERGARGQSQRAAPPIEETGPPPSPQIQERQAPRQRVEASQERRSEPQVRSDARQEGRSDRAPRFQSTRERGGDRTGGYRSGGGGGSPRGGGFDGGGGPGGGRGGGRSHR
jgi:hypothetical protein